MIRTLHSLLESGVTVLTASRRLAYALRMGFAQSALSSGKTVWRSPRVLPWSTWLRQQWLELRSQNDSSRSDALAEQLLNPAQARILWDQVVHGSELAHQLLNPSSAARMAARSWQRLNDYSIDIGSLAATASVETQALLEWIAQFERRCAELQAIDEARLARLALQVEFVPDEIVCLAGFDVLPPVLQSLSDRWQRAGKLATLDAEDRPTGEVAKIMAADREDELELAARWARARVDAGVARIGVVINSLQDRRHEVRRAFQDVFAPAARCIGSDDPSMPVTIAAPESLDTYPLVADALALLQLSNGSADSLLIGRLLRSPFLIAARSERHARAIADVRLREEQRSQWDWLTFERWAGMTECTQLQLAARTIAGLTRTEAGAAAPSVWSERWIRILQTSGWPGERKPSSVEYQTVGKFQETLAQFGTLDAVLGPVSGFTALQRLRELTQETSFEAQSEAGVVTVIDPTTVAGMQFDALWVAGLESSKLPAIAEPDPLLPIDVQRVAGMPEASARGMLQLGRRQLHRLIRSAPEVILSWPHRDDDAELQPSPLLADVPLRTLDTLILAPAQSLSDMLFAQRPVPQMLADQNAPRLQVQSARGGSMTIELQSRCAFRAQAQLRLRAEPLQVVSRGIEPRERGNLLHKVLEGVWHELGGQQRLLEMNDDQLVSLLHGIAARAAATTLQPANRVEARLVDLEVRAIVQQVQELMTIERQRPPFTVRSAETSERFALGELFIKLQPDRIDRLPNGGDLLVDYKLGESHKPRQWMDTVPGRPRRPQLPLYALAHAESVSALSYIVAAPGTVEYRGWSDGADVATGVDNYSPRPGMPPDWQALLAHWRTVLTALAENYVAGVATVDPLPQECRTCHLSTLCRVHELGSAAQPEPETDDE